MKVIDIIRQAKDPLISFEIIPPERGGDIQSLLSVIEDVSKFHPPFIDITSHSAEVIYNETPQGIKKRVVRKRPGTLGICALIQNKYNIEAVPHILCRNFTKEETEDFLIELNYLGIENVLAIQGDNKGYQKELPKGRSANVYALDLVKQVNEMNHGKYLDQDLMDARSSQFCVGVSGYPEKHFESPNLAVDMKYTKEKIDAGAGYIVTQMFFDNKKFFEYEAKMRAMGVEAPIIPGLKILVTKSQLSAIPRNFFISIPEELAGEVIEAKPEHVLEIGVRWAVQQAQELIEHGVPTIHFYIMLHSKPIKMVMEKLNLFKKIFPAGSGK